MNNALLANNEDLGRIGGPTGFGPFGNLPFDVGEAAKGFNRVISAIIGVITIVAGIWFMFQFIIAGFSWLTAGGNQESVSNAQARMRNAFIGIIIVVAAWAIIGVIGSLIGLDILHPERLIPKLGPGG